MSQSAPTLTIRSDAHSQHAGMRVEAGSLPVKRSNNSPTTSSHLQLLINLWPHGHGSCVAQATSIANITGPALTPFSQTCLAHCPAERREGLLFFFNFLLSLTNLMPARLLCLPWK